MALVVTFISSDHKFFLQAAARCQEGRQLLCSRRAQAGLRHEDPWYQPGLTQGQEGPAAPQTEADQQRSLHQDEQGHPEHAQNLR